MAVINTADSPYVDDDDDDHTPYVDDPLAAVA